MTSTASDSHLRTTAAIALVIGALFGIGGTFASSASLRALAWGIDGTALIVGTALLTVHHVRRGNDVAAAGFLVFAAGQSLVLSSAALTLDASGPSFGAGVGLWAASLVLVGSSKIVPTLFRITGFIAAVLFAMVAVHIFLGDALTPLSQPLPYFAYPFLAATILGWAWAHYRNAA